MCAVGYLGAETPYEFKKVAGSTADANQGAADAPLFLINHWLDSFASRIRDAHTVNSSAVPGAATGQCRTERGQIPNFVAVDNYAIGDLFTEVDKLNGVGGSDGGIDHGRAGTVIRSGGGRRVRVQRRTWLPTGWKSFSADQPRRRQGCGWW